jgi:hypothetical protein
MHLQRFSDEVMLTSVVLNDWERNDQRALDSVVIHLSEQGFRGVRSAAVLRLTDVGMRVEDTKPVPHRRAPASWRA